MKLGQLIDTVMGNTVINQKPVIAFLLFSWCALRKSKIVNIIY